MTTVDPFIDPLTLQRLVDGELSESQLQQVLIDAQHCPDHWQEIACGFIEQQIWNQTLAEEMTEKPSNDCHVPVATSNLTNDQAAPGITVPAPPANASSSDHALPARRSVGWRQLALAAGFLAAGFLVAVTLGYSSRQIQNPPIAKHGTGTKNANSMASDQFAAANPQTTQALNPADKSPVNRSPAAGLEIGPVETSGLVADYHLEVPASNELLADWVHPAKVARVPLYPISDQRDLLQLRQHHQPILPPAMIEELNQSGYQLKQRIKYISGRLDDGRRYYVPVQTIKLLPGL